MSVWLGSDNTGTGNRLCFPADVGYYVPDAGSSTETQCPAGTTTAGTGSTSASDCEAAPAFTSPADITFTAGWPGSFTVTTTGTPSPTITESGGLDGLTLSDGVLSGTPTAVGVFPVTFTASNGFGQDATQAAVITVLGLHVTTASLPEATPGQAYNTQLTALGGTAPYKWKASAKLPKGLKLSSTGILSGSVSARVAAGTATVSVEVTDSTPRHKGNGDGQLQSGDLVTTTIA